MRKVCAGTWLISTFKEELVVKTLPCMAPGVLDTLNNLSGHLLTFVQECLLDHLSIISDVFVKAY